MKNHRASQSAQYLQSSFRTRSEGDNVSPNTNSRNLPDTKPQICLIKRPEIDSALHTNTSVEFKSQGQVSREAGFSKSAEVRQFFVTRPAIVLEGHGVTTVCRECSAMRDDTSAEAQGGETIP